MRIIRESGTQIGTPARAQSSGTWGGGMPETFGASTMADYSYSIYCSYSPLASVKTIGNTETYPSVSTAPNRRAVPVTFNTEGMIESISIYHNGGAGRVLMGVYADLAGLPSEQMGKTASTVINSTAGWQTVSLTSPVPVKEGETVWLSWVFENNPGIRYSIGKPGRAQSPQTWTAGIPATFGASTMADYNYSIYCSYSQNINAESIGISEIYQGVSTAPNRRAMPVTFNESGTIESISIYHNGGNGKVLMGVYADQTGLPSVQMGRTASTEINATTGWQTVSLISPVQVKAGQTVWLSWVFENNPGIRYAVGKPGRAQSSGTWSAGMPADYGVSGFADYKYSVYCTFRAATETLTLKSESFQMMLQFKVLLKLKIRLLHN